MERRIQILRSYRRLYRHGLYVVQYSVPSRYVLRDQLRLAYRSGSAADFNCDKIDGTVAFLQSAAEQTGTAHKIVKNLLRIWWQNPRESINRSGGSILTGEEAELRRTCYEHFSVTIKMLNESMGMCLPHLVQARAPAQEICG